MTQVETDLRKRSYQVYGACTLNQAIERYRARFGRDPVIVVAHPKQVADTIARPAEFCQCSREAGQGPWYLWPSRKDLVKEA